MFLPGEFHGQRRLAGFSPWDRIESDRTERLTLSLLYIYKKKTEAEENKVIHAVPMVSKGLTPFEVRRVTLFH